MGTSLLRFVKESCPFWTDDPAQQCLGILVDDDDGPNIRIRKPGPCRIVQGKPCFYFSICVLGSERLPQPHVSFVLDPMFEKRVWYQYQKIDPTATRIYTAGSDRICPDCGEAMLRHRRRYCDRCRRKRRRQTQREYKRRSQRRNPKVEERSNIVHEDHLYELLKSLGLSTERTQ